MVGIVGPGGLVIGADLIGGVLGLELFTGGEDIEDEDEVKEEETEDFRRLLDLDALGLDSKFSTNKGKCVLCIAGRLILEYLMTQIIVLSICT